MYIYIYIYVCFLVVVELLLNCRYRSRTRGLGSSVRPYDIDLRFVQHFAKEEPGNRKEDDVVGLGF